jgi:hypothetical protein
LILNTTNAGNVWFSQNSGTNQNLLSVCFVDARTGYICGKYGTLLKTSNSGSEWEIQLSRTDNDLNSLYFIDSMNGYIAGNLGNILKTTTGGEPIGVKDPSYPVPKEYLLSQNFPNPFNPITKIKFSLPSPSKGGVVYVRLVIYDVLGKVVASLIPPLGGGQEGLSPGTYEVTWDASNYPSGVYFYRLIAQNYSETRKMVLIK